MAATDHYTIITADTHAGGSHAPYREYLDAQFLEDFDAWRARYKNPFKQLGPVDILVNNAGIPENGGVAPFVDSKPQAWMPYIELNLLGAMYCMHSARPSMIERGWGRVIQISSGAASVGLPIGVSVYRASKAGIEGLLRHVAVEVGPSGVTVNTLALGLMENTAQLATGQLLDRMVRGIPVGRLGHNATVRPASVNDTRAADSAERIDDPDSGVILE